jgi:hypothetical protein
VAYSPGLSLCDLATLKDTLNDNVWFPIQGKFEKVMHTIGQIKYCSCLKGTAYANLFVQKYVESQ